MQLRKFEHMFWVLKKNISLRCIFCEHTFWLSYVILFNYSSGGLNIYWNDCIITQPLLMTKPFGYMCKFLESGDIRQETLNCQTAAYCVFTFYAFIIKVYEIIYRAIREIRKKNTLVSASYDIGLDKHKF